MKPVYFAALSSTFDEGGPQIGDVHPYDYTLSKASEVLPQMPDCVTYV